MTQEPIKRAPTLFFLGAERWPGLSKLTEECGEVLQVVGKLIANGGQRAHWDGSDLGARLEEELGDLLAAIAFVRELRGGACLPVDELLDNTAIDKRAAEKLETFRGWHYGHQYGEADFSEADASIEPTQVATLHKLRDAWDALEAVDSTDDIAARVDAFTRAVSDAVESVREVPRG